MSQNLTEGAAQFKASGQTLNWSSCYTLQTGRAGTMNGTVTGTGTKENTYS